jgi:hypothetical protein
MDELRLGSGFARKVKGVTGNVRCRASMAGRDKMRSPMAPWGTMTREIKEMKGGLEGEGDPGSCGLASAGGIFPGRPAQNRTNDPGRLFSFHRAFSVSGPDPLQTAARGDGRLEAVP